MAYIGRSPETEALEKLLELLESETQGGTREKSLSERLSTAVPGFNWQQSSKKERVRLLSEFARKDEARPHTWWRERFRSEFPEGYSTELGRVRDEFYGEYPRGTFAIKGLAFYKGDS